MHANCNHEGSRHSEEQSISTSTILDPFGLLLQIYNLQFKGPCLCNEELNNKIKVIESRDCETSYRHFVHQSADRFVCDV